MEQNTDKKISNDKELIISFSIIFPANFMPHMQKLV